MSKGKLLLIVVGVAVVGFVAWWIPNDAARKRDVQRIDHLREISAQLKRFSDNNKGKVPLTVFDFDALFKPLYLKTELKDPSTQQPYKYAVNPDKGVIGYRSNENCAGGNAGLQYFALKIKLESGKIGCVDNFYQK